MSPFQTKFACAKLPNKEMNVASIPISFKKTLPGAGNTGLCRFYTPCGDPIPTPKARHREFREPGRSCGAEGLVRNFPATDILPESPKRRVLRWHARKRKRGPLSETPFPLAKKPLTLAGSNPSNTDNDAERRAGRLGVGARSRHLVFEVVATAAVLALTDVAHNAAILHLAGLRGIRRILKSPGEPVVVLVDADAVRMAGKLEDRLFGFPDDSGFVGLAFNRMQTSLGADESWRAVLVDVAFHRDPGPRSDFLTFVDAKKMTSPGGLSMLSDIGMEVVFAQAKANAQISESLCPFLALRHDSCGLPLGCCAHLLNTIPSPAHDGVLKVAAEAETLPKPSAFIASGNDRKGDDEGFRAHGRTLAQGCEMSVPCAGALSGMDECRIPPSE